MAREFVLSSGGLTIAGTTTLAFINPPASPNVDIEILRVWVGQSGSTTSAQQRIQLVTQVTAFPTLTSKTPVKTKFAEPNASVITGGTAGAAGTSGVNASAEGAGAKTVIFDDVFNVLNGWLWLPTPDEQLNFPAGFASGFGVYLPVAPSSLTNWTVGVVFRER